MRSFRSLYMLALLPVLATPTYGQSPESNGQLAELVASDGTSGDLFGASVAIYGGIAVVGAPGVSVGSNQSQGAAYVFFDSAGQWVEAAKLVAPDGAADDLFGSSVAIEEGTIVVGAVSHSVKSRQWTGAAYVFTKSPRGWREPANVFELVASDRRSRGYFGSSVSISGDTVVVGASAANTPCAAEGAAYVFVKPVDGWRNSTQTAKLTASDCRAYAGLGDSVAIVSDTIVAGAGCHAPGCEGSVYLYVKPPQGWVNMTETAQLKPSNGRENDNFGFAVSFSGNTVVAGAPGMNKGAGAVYVFTEPPSGWASMTETAKMPVAGSHLITLGQSVAILNSRIFAGAPTATISGELRQGVVLEYLEPPTGWTDTWMPDFGVVSADGTAEDEFGWSVMVSKAQPTRLLIGVPFHNAHTGAAYIFGRN